MAYNPNNNPYVPGDPYSYDLKWIVSEIKRIAAEFEGAKEELKDYIDDYLANLDLDPLIMADLQELISSGALDQIFEDFLADNKVVTVDSDEAAVFTDDQMQQGRYNIAAGIPVNMLDNPDFKINQRGASTKTVGSTYEYFVDRWLFHNGTYTVTSAGISIAAGTNVTAAIQQRTGIPNTADIVGKKATFSAKIDGQIYSVTGTLTTSTTPVAETYGNITVEFFYNASYGYTIAVLNSLQTAILVENTKFEIAESSTLAYSAPANTAEELQKCWYYFRRLTNNTAGSTYAMAYGSCTSTTAAIFPNIFAAYPMRAEPTVTSYGTINVRSGNNTDHAATSVVLRYNEPVISIGVNVASGLTQFAEARLFMTTGAYIDFSADL